MKYFKSNNNQIFAYDDEQVRQGYGKGLTLITEAEKDEILAPTAEELAEQAKAQAKLDRKEAMLTGFDYNGTMISVTAEDGNGLVQVKTAFDMGLTETVFKLENGNSLLLNNDNFNEFATVFIAERNKFFQQDEGV